MSSSFPKVLVFGALGQVGTELRQLLQQQGATDFVGVDRDECDLMSPGAARKLIQSVQPNVIINAAAYTAVDKAETSGEIARVLNVDAPREMAEAAREFGAIFIHYSTDYVFNGSNDRPWAEEDAPAPLNVYGQTKLDGERAVLGVPGANFVFRTSWVYGSHGANFLLTMLRLGESRDELSVVADQVGAPTWSKSLAEVALHTAKMFWSAEGKMDIQSATRLAGLYHATCSGVTNWHEFAVEIFAEARQHGLPLAVKNVKPIRTEDYPTAAQRPRYSVLSNEKLNGMLGFKFPEWREALECVMQEVVAKRSAASTVQA